MNGRDAALRVLIACRVNGAWSEAALKELHMDRREAALASRLCYGVQQNRLLLDYWIDGFARGKLQPVVRDILRLALYQLQFLDKIPASAAVHEAVEQTKRFANPAAARTVNGILRSVLRAGALPMPQDAALRYSHPEPLAALLRAQYGAQTAQRLMQSNNEITPTVLQVNTLKTDTETLKNMLSQAGTDVSTHPWLPDCLEVRATGGLERLDAFAQGLFYVQDTAARLSVLAARPQAGMHVLDCCAAPGGKSFAAAIAMGNTGSLLSCDIHPHKLPLIEKGAQRLGITVLRTCLHDAAQPQPEWDGHFDLVLADVPCSGLGVIRKKPDIRYKTPDASLPRLQERILRRQAQYVRAGGVLLYSTCTVLRRENEDVAEAFLRACPDFEPETMQFPAGSGIPDAAMTTLLPCDHGTDGFFIAKFRRKP